jgi:CheY-like chemotaxis protein/anti-sigma regulatory factor (Ser/Thr protein kinase)
VSPAAEAKGITIERDLEDLDPIAGDRDRLQQVFWNLLSNAVKFTPRDGRVTVRVRRQDQDAVVAVEDNGIGISPDFLPYVFDRFRQADGSATRRHGGLGLGMAIVRYLVELHGGTVRAESEGENRGATFTAALPIRVPEAAEETAATQSDDLPVATQDTPDAQLEGLRILVVDDDGDSRGFLATLLEEHGAEVVAAGSTVQALDLFRFHQVDVLVSDIAMPGQDGYDLIHRVRDLPAERGGLTPAVALTAYVRVEDQHAALAAGFQRHLKKPVDAADLIAVVAELAALKVE